MNTDKTEEASEEVVGELIPTGREQVSCGNSWKRNLPGRRRAIRKWLLGSSI